MTRVRDVLERSRKSLLDGTARQRIEGSTRHLLERSRATVAQFVGQPATRETGPQEILAGVCSSVALRDLNLVDSLLEQLEKMEAEEDDPDALARLYRLDHLATRLRRNGENLRVLAGRDAGGGSSEPASLVDVIRAGVSAVEHYARVELGTVASLGVVGFAADDVSRLLAELLDN
ncbi:MAG: ATP-binding protein, partial [Saccharopolyspora sp.]|nr:ATP-binding protein [Saccharopolyspora sp.]